MKKYFSFLLIIFINTESFSQTNIANEDISDGKSLIEAYLAPFGNSLGASLNNGWYNTAKPHKLGGFDLTFTLNTVLVPQSVTSFNIEKALNGNNFNSLDNETATFLGGDDVSVINYSSASGISEDFEMPKGIDLKAVPLPMLQAGIGLIMGTEVNIRYIPLQDLGSVGEVNLFGIGAKHDILQWIPLADVLPFSVSIQGGFTNLNSTVEIQSQDIELNIKATNMNILVSKKFLMLTAYTGIGYNSAVTTFKVNKEYTIGIGGNVIQFDSEKLSEFSFETQNALRATIGMRFQIALLALQANYTFADYPVATIGLGISMR